MHCIKMMKNCSLCFPNHFLMRIPQHNNNIYSICSKMKFYQKKLLSNFKVTAWGEIMQEIINVI